MTASHPSLKNLRLDSLLPQAVADIEKLGRRCRGDRSAWNGAADGIDLNVARADRFRYLQPVSLIVNYWKSE